MITSYRRDAVVSWPYSLTDERRVLLDPTVDNNFERHFSPKLDGELVGRTRSARATIAIHDLNRSERRDQRYYRYHFLIDRLFEFVEAGYLPDEGRNKSYWDDIFNFSEIEFGGTWFLLLRRLILKIGSRLKYRPKVTPEAIGNTIFELLSRTDTGSLLAAAQSEVAAEDEKVRVAPSFIGAPASTRDPIASVEVSNFKAIESLKLDFAPPRLNMDRLDVRNAPSMVILGENATGKSSILEAITLALCSDSARQALKLRWPLLELDPSQLGDAQSTEELKGTTVRVTFASGDTSILTIDDGLPTTNGELGSITVPVFAYGAFRRFSAGTRRASPEKHIQNLFDSTLLSNPEPWLKKLGDIDFEMVVRALRNLLSIDGDFDVIERGGGRGIRMVTSVTEPDGTRHLSRTPLGVVSSGYRSMLAMLCDIMSGLLDPEVHPNFESFETARGIVLIDEIEAHLHPRWKVQVMSSLRAALPGMTFIVTTHDPLCLRGMGDGEVVVLQRIAAADSFRPSSMPILVEKMEELPSVTELRIEQLLTSDFFQLFSTDDAVADRQLAHIADLLAAQDRGEQLQPDEQRTLDGFKRDITSALPVGSSEVHRIVQEAVAEFLRRRREASSKTLRELRGKAKAEILAALEAL
ncbi:AAA family ATPase [Rhizobium ruizarguesonis]